MLGHTDFQQLVEQTFDRDLRPEYAVGIGCQNMFPRQGFRPEAYQLVFAVLFEQSCNSLEARADSVPSERSARVFVFCFSKADISGNQDIVLPSRISVVVRSRVTSGEGAELVLNVERLYEIDVETSG